MLITLKSLRVLNHSSKIGEQNIHIIYNIVLKRSSVYVYRVSTLTKLFLTASESIVQSLKSIGQF